jgi:outer membrane usher protein
MAARLSDWTSTCIRLLLLLAVLGIPHVAGAQPAPPPHPDDDQRQRAILEIVINEVSKGEVLVVLAPPDVLVSVRLLQKAGLHVVDGRRQVIDAEPWVSLASLAPGVTFVLDEARLQVRLTARPELLETTVVAAPGNKPAGLVYGRNASGFLNYSITTGSSGTMGLFAEAGVSAGGALINTTLSRPTGQALVRGLSSLTFDDRDRMTRWTVGDAAVNSGTLGGGLFLGGVTFAREYSVDPYFIRRPTLNLAGSVTTPSVVEVYANNQLVRREEIQPGQFEFNDLSLQTGRGDVRMVIRDAFGREREISNSYYLSSSALAKGLQEFSYSVGFERLQQSIASWQYGTPAALGRHRIGLTDHVTLGYRFEAGTSLANAGPLLNFTLPVGEVEVAGSVSRSQGRTGASAETGYAYFGRIFGAGASVTATDPLYEHLGVTPVELRMRYQTHAFFSLHVGSRTTFSLQHDRFRNMTRALTEQASALGSVRLTSRVDLQASVGRVNAVDRRGYEASIGLNFSLGNRTSANVGYEHRVDGSGTVTELEHSMPVGRGLGYLARFQTGTNQLTSGELQYQTGFGRYDLRHDETSGSGGTTATIAGGVVGIGGGLFLSRPVEQSYALVQVPDVKGVRAYASNQEVGKTDRNGNLLVPNLLAYYGNQLSIADEDVPMNHAVAAREITLAPPFRGGAVARFPVARVQGVTGIVTIDVQGKPVVPAYGEVTLRAGQAGLTSPVGADGAFYFENVPPGSYTAALEYKADTCTFILKVPASDRIVIELGTLRCVAAARKDDQQ